MKSITALIVSFSLITFFSCALTGNALAEKSTEIYTRRISGGCTSLAHPAGPLYLYRQET